MTEFDRNLPPVVEGGWRDAEVLRRWSFARRTPQQRLDWLVEALTLRYMVTREVVSAKGRGPATEICAMSEDTAHPKDRVKVGSALAELAEPYGGFDLDIARDKSVHDPPDFE